MRKLLMVAAGILAACISTAGIAQEVAKPAVAKEDKKPLTEIVVNDGVAFSWKKHEKGTRVDYDVVSAWLKAKKGEQPDVADCDRYKTKLKGATWCFASAANLKRFLAETDKDGNNSYLPFVGGYCAQGMFWGVQSPGDPRTARIRKDDRDREILVVHSGAKWWTKFLQNEFIRIHDGGREFHFAIRLGDIVPNDKVTESSAQRR